MGARRRAMRELVRYGCMPGTEVNLIGRDAICKAQRARRETTTHVQTRLRIWQTLVAALESAGIGAGLTGAKRR